MMLSNRNGLWFFFRLTNCRMRSLFSLYVIAKLLSSVCPKDVTDGSIKAKVEKLITKTLSCQPNITYLNELEICLCTKNGHWPNNNCSHVFGKLYNDTVFKNECRKDSYVRVHCNICKCDKRGEINYNRCTRHSCESGNVSNKSRKSIESIPGKCSPKTWYSFAPCQLCYCVSENKLVCNPANRQLEKHVLGKYNFSVCGDMFLKDTIDLIPFTNKLLRLGSKNFEPNKTLEIEYAPVPVPPENDDVQNVKTLNSDRIADKSDSSNSIESDDDANLSSVNAGTRMPELDRVASGEHVNIHTQKSDELISDADSPVREKEQILIPDNENEDDTVSSKIDLRNQNYNSNEKNTGEFLFRDFSLPGIFKKFLGLRKTPTRRAVSLDSRSACKPGSEIAKDCNMCYCMRNGNLLCTKKLC